MQCFDIIRTLSLCLNSWSIKLYKGPSFHDTVFKMISNSANKVTVSMPNPGGTVMGSFFYCGVASGLRSYHHQP